MDSGGCRAGATCAISGGLLLVVGTCLHPVPAEPNDAAQAFAVYVADRSWVAGHFMQLAGIVLALAALIILAQQLETGRSRFWSRPASAGAIASMAQAVALQAVDGIALRAMIRNWATAAATQKDIAFQSVFAVRQLEIGLASVPSLLLGATAILYGVALLDGHMYPKWLGVLAIVGGVPTSLSGVLMAYSGFSDLEMAIDMPASLILVTWVMALGILLWRRRQLLRDNYGTALYAKSCGQRFKEFRCPPRQPNDRDLLAAIRVLAPGLGGGFMPGEA